MLRLLILYLPPQAETSQDVFQYVPGGTESTPGVILGSAFGNFSPFSGALSGVPR